MLKRFLVSTVVALSTFVAVHASDSILRADHPDHYVVVRGDTLWDIAGRFLREPWLWPEIWQANPQVANPHLIYPGDVLNLAYLGGRPTLSSEGPRVRESDEQPIPALPLAEVEPFLKNMRVLDEDTFRNLPYVVALEENRLRGAESNYVYARNLDAEPGERVAIVRPTLVYRDASKFNQRTGQREERVRSRPWHAADSIHDRARTRSRDNLIGYEVIEIGYAQVIRGGDPVTLLLQDSEREVKAGDLVMPVDDQPFDLYFHPHQADEMPAGLEVMAVTDSAINAGKYQVVSLNRGAVDGIANGQVYSIFKPGQEIRDRVRYPQANPLRDSIRDDAHVTLPDDFAGHVMVFRVFDRMSYALVMDAMRPVQPRDRLRAPHNL
ncbi:MAG: LysM peptidoglycan-binding domain-containing protein [Xanthomonadales bacterium]|nr:LysM peptidoglycan-binding domain-containing protein [Xanthomonadales bacterium]